jgi:RsiW-degrading membrane proteinase PrsW (M82 family)
VGNERTLDDMGVAGVPWIASCALVGGAWATAASWRAEGGRFRAAFRGALGGAAAVFSASGAFDVIQFAGVDLGWASIERDAWPGLVLALLIGVVEEAAKLAGIVLAAPPRQGARGVLRTAMLVAVVFAVSEAAVGMVGGSWGIALGRAALGPVAHALLSAPMAVVLADAAERPDRLLPVRLALAFAAAATLHGLGDWSIARPVWGRAGFMAALLAPTLWLYVRARAAVPAMRALAVSLPPRSRP